MVIIKRLNIFIDESGDFGFIKGSSELYVIFLTLYESEISIENEIEYLNNRLRRAEHGGLHLGDLIAKRGDYSSFSLEQRKKLFWSIFNLTKQYSMS